MAVILDDVTRACVLLRSDLGFPSRGLHRLRKAVIFSIKQNIRLHLMHLLTSFGLPASPKCMHSRVHVAKLLIQLFAGIEIPLFIQNRASPSLLQALLHETVVPGRESDADTLPPNGEGYKQSADSECDTSDGDEHVRNAHARHPRHKSRWDADRASVADESDANKGLCSELRLSQHVVQGTATILAPLGMCQSQE